MQAHMQKKKKNLNFSQHCTACMLTSQSSLRAAEPETATMAC